MSRINLKRTANLLHFNTPFTYNTDQYLKKLPQDSSAAFMLI